MHQLGERAKRWLINYVSVHRSKPSCVEGRIEEPSYNLSVAFFLEIGITSIQMYYLTKSSPSSLAGRGLGGGVLRAKVLRYWMINNNRCRTLFRINLLALIHMHLNPVSAQQIQLLVLILHIRTSRIAKTIP
jgi:hypothetical protein